MAEEGRNLLKSESTDEIEDLTAQDKADIKAITQKLD